MYISDFSLHDFRSYSELVAHFDPGITVLTGHNGAGKTNLVEGVEYLATHSSHRVSADSALIRQGAPAAVIRARVNAAESARPQAQAEQLNSAAAALAQVPLPAAAVTKHTASGVLPVPSSASVNAAGRATLLELEIHAGRANRARLNRANVRPAEALGIVRTILFAPADLSLINGDPATRRRFLDVLMIQERPQMRAVKLDYEKVLRQRAALLKTAGKMRRAGRRFDESALAVWDQQIADLGAKIVRARADIIARLQPFVTQYYQAVSGENTPAQVSYAANTAPDQIAETLIRMRGREIAAGLNLVGPHRDDMQLALGSLPAKGYASHGESWSYALALRLASWQVLRGNEWSAWASGGDPILILDDVFAELDARRRQLLVDLVKPAEQVFVTAAVGDDLPANLQAHIYYVTGGQLRSAAPTGPARAQDTQPAQYSAPFTPANSGPAANELAANEPAASELAASGLAAGGTVSGEPVSGEPISGGPAVTDYPAGEQS